VVDAVRRLMDRGDLDIIYEEHDRLTNTSFGNRQRKQAA